jgi:hypothetical protein
VLNDPGKPWQNGTDESFNGKFCDECLSIEWFRSRRECGVFIESWRQQPAVAQRYCPNSAARSRTLRM